jgi:hypothetical protein
VTAPREPETADLQGVEPPIPDPAAESAVPNSAAPDFAAPHSSALNSAATNAETADGAEATAPDVERGLPTVWEQMGGVSGMLDSGLPIVVFVVANSLGGLTTGIVAAVAAALLICTLRLIRRRPVTQAVGGLLGVGIAAYIAHRSGSAGGFFVLGIYSYLVWIGLLVVSMVVRWPLVGLIWEGINGRGGKWRSDRALVRRYDLATGVWVLVFGARFLVQNALLTNDAIGWLAVAKIAMGFPLYVLALATSVWIVLRGTGHTFSIRSLFAAKR